MPVAKLNIGGTPDTTKADELNNSLDTFIRQAMRKEPLPRTGEGPAQWMQWLHSMDQSDISGRSILNPSNLQMQKCEKCSREFCSPINHRRHIRLHRRSLNSDKESRKYRDLLGAFWDKLSVDEIKEVVSLQDISLKEVIQAKPSRLPVTSEELFGILDDASERTFLCAGTADSVEKYVFDGEADKIGFDSRNLVACTSFLFEQKLVKAWVADKNAEALRCQKLLFEEEEAAQKKQAELLERKKVKKLRQKEQKAREQSNEEKGNLEVPLAEVDNVPGLSDSNSDIPDVSMDVSTCLKLVRFSRNEDTSTESQCDFSHQHLDSVKVQNVEPQPVSTNAERKAELLERKKVKKLRQKEQKAREQSNEEKENVEVPADCFEVPLAEVLSVPGPSDSNSDIPDVSLNVSTCRKLVQFSSNEDMSIESQCDFSHQHLDSVRVQYVEPQPVSANSRWLSSNAEWQAPKLQRFGRNGSNQNHQAKVEPLMKHKDSGSPVNSSKIWTRKVRVESDDASILEVRKEVIDQKQRNSEVMIGSLSVPVKACSTDQQGNCPVEARDDFGSTESVMPKKCNIVEKPAKHNAFHVGSDRAAAKLWRPVRHEVGRQDPEEGVMFLKFDDRMSLNENPLQSCPMDSSGSPKNCEVPDRNAHQDWEFLISTAKAFLAQRWKKAIAGDHVTLVLSPDTEFSGRPEVPSSSSDTASASDSGEHCAVSRAADDQLAKDGVVNSSSSRKNKVKFRPKPEKDIKTKYIPKQKNHLGSKS